MEDSIQGVLYHDSGALGFAIEDDYIEVVQSCWRFTAQLESILGLYALRGQLITAHFDRFVLLPVCSNDWATGESNLREFNRFFIAWNAAVIVNAAMH